LRLSWQPADEAVQTTITLSVDDIAVLSELVTEAKAYRGKFVALL
jgi:hypothetical protein